MKEGEERKGKVNQGYPCNLNFLNFIRSHDRLTDNKSNNKSFSKISLNEARRRS